MRLRPPLRRWRRRPSVFWLTTIALALTTGGATVAVAGRAAEQMAAWGADEVVAVAEHHLDPGTVLASGDVRWERRPLAVVPVGALTDGTTTTGRVVVAAVPEGETLVGDRLAPDGVEGIAAFMPLGARAVTVPPSNHPIRVRPLDRVDVWRGTGRATAALLIADEATVVDVADDGAVTIAMAPDQVGEVAAAVVEGSVVLALRSR